MLLVPGVSGGPGRERRGEQVHDDRQPDAEGPPGDAGRGPGPALRGILHLRAAGGRARPLHHRLLPI